MAIKLADTVEPMGDFPAVNSTDVNINIDGTPKNLQDAFDDGDFGGGGGLPVVTEVPQNPEDGDVVLITDYEQEKSGILQYHNIMYYAFKNTEHNMVLYTTTQELTWEMKFYVNDGGMIPYSGDYGLDQLDPNGEYFIIGLYIEGEFVNNLRFDHDSSLDLDGSDWHNISSGLKNYNVQIYRYMSEDVIKKLLPTIHDDEFILTVGCDYDWGTDAYYCSMGWYHPPGDHNYRYWTLNSGTMVYQFYEGWNGELEFREYNLTNPQIQNAFKVVDDFNDINLGDTALFLLPPDTGTNYINGGIYKCVESALIQKAGGSEYFYILLDDLGPSQGDILYNDYGLRVAVITDVDSQNETFTVRDEFGTVVNFNFSDISETTDRITIYVAQGITDRCLPRPSDCTLGITLRYTGENYNDGNMDIKYNHVYECDIDDNDNKIFIDITPKDDSALDKITELPLVANPGDMSIFDGENNSIFKPVSIMEENFNPKEHGFYEKVNDELVPTEDTSIQNNITYTIWGNDNTFVLTEKVVPSPNDILVTNKGLYKVPSGNKLLSYDSGNDTITVKLYYNNNPLVFTKTGNTVEGGKIYYKKVNFPYKKGHVYEVESNKTFHAYSSDGNRIYIDNSTNPKVGDDLYIIENDALLLFGKVEDVYFDDPYFQISLYGAWYEDDYETRELSIWTDTYKSADEGLETAEQALSVASTASLQTTELEQNVALYNSYSLDETFTGGTWINGKKIYKKTFDMGDIPSPSSGNTFVRIPFNVDFEDIIDIKGMIVPNASSTEAQKEYYSIPKPPKVGQSGYNVSLKIKPYNNVLNLELETNSELNNKKAYATVYYTKVND